MDELVIEPVMAEWIDALVLGDDVFAERFGRPVLDGWAGFPEVLPHLQAETRGAHDDRWGSHLMFRPGPSGALIGLGGWKGAPDAHGAAELGYAVAPDAQGRGVATAFVAELVERGRHAGVRSVVAHTLASESASTGVLRKSGFRHVATHGGEGDEIWRWERHLTPRLTLEPREVEHAAGLCAALADESVGRWIGGPEVTTVEAMTERIAHLNSADPSQWGETWLNWTVFADTEPGRPIIGRVEATVHHRTPRTAEFAYVFGPAWWGRGYATEATAWMLDVLRDAHEVGTAYATVDPHNAPSIRLLVRLGFERCEPPAEGLGSYDPGDDVFASQLTQ